LLDLVKLPKCIVHHSEVGSNWISMYVGVMISMNALARGLMSSHFIDYELLELLRGLACE